MSDANASATFEPTPFYVRATGRDHYPSVESNPGIVDEIQRAFKKEPVSATFLTFGLLDLLPVPTDIGYFYTQAYLEKHRAEMSEFKYKALEGVNYFGWDALWYLTIAGFTYSYGEDTADKIHLGGAIVASGALVAALWYIAKQEKPKP